MSVHTLYRYFIWTLYRDTLRKGKNLLSEAFVILEKTRSEYLDKEILRAAMIAELDGINIYEQMANLAKSEKFVKFCLTLLDIA